MPNVSASSSNIVEKVQILTWHWTQNKRLATDVCNPSFVEVLLFKIIPVILVFASRWGFLVIQEAKHG